MIGATTGKSRATSGRKVARPSATPRTPVRRRGIAGPSVGKRSEIRSKTLASTPAPSSGVTRASSRLRRRARAQYASLASERPGRPRGVAAIRRLGRLQRGQSEGKLSRRFVQSSLTLGLLGGADRAHAQVDDHLMCYKTKDPLALKGVVDHGRNPLKKWWEQQGSNLRPAD